MRAGARLDHMRAANGGGAPLPRARSQSETKRVSLHAGSCAAKRGNVSEPEILLRADHGGEQDHFGDSVLFAHDYILVNAREEDGGFCSVDGDQTDSSAAGSGAAYVLR